VAATPTAHFPGGARPLLAATDRQAERSESDRESSVRLPRPRTTSTALPWAATASSTAPRSPWRCARHDEQDPEAARTSGEALHPT